MQTASKQFYIEHENIMASKQLLRLNFKNYDILLLQQVEEYEKASLTDLISRSTQHAYNALSMCHVMNQPLTDYHTATLYMQNKGVNSDTALELTNVAQTPIMQLFCKININGTRKP